MADEDVELDRRIAMTVALFASRGIAGGVTFPDGLRVDIATIPVPVEPRSTAEPPTEADRLKEERRVHYASLFSRPVTDDELKRLP